METPHTSAEGNDNLPALLPRSGNCFFPVNEEKEKKEKAEEVEEDGEQDGGGGGGGSG